MQPAIFQHKVKKSNLSLNSIHVRVDNTSYLFLLFIPFFHYVLRQKLIWMSLPMRFWGGHEVDKKTVDDELSRKTSPARLKKNLILLMKSSTTPWSANFMNFMEFYSVIFVWYSKKIYNYVRMKKKESKKRYKIHKTTTQIEHWMEHDVDDAVNVKENMNTDFIL